MVNMVRKILYKKRVICGTLKADGRIWPSAQRLGYALFKYAKTIKIL